MPKNLGVIKVSFELVEQLLLKSKYKVERVLPEDPHTWDNHTFEIVISGPDLAPIHEGERIPYITVTNDA